MRRNQDREDEQIRKYAEMANALQPKVALVLHALAGNSSNQCTNGPDPSWSR